LNTIPNHWPGAESDVEVNVIREPDDPFACSVPVTVNCRVDEFPSTTTPGETVNVTPDATVTFPVITYGELAAVHVVFDEIVPDTFVAQAGIGTTSTTTTASSARIRSTAPSPKTKPILTTGLSGAQDDPMPEAGFLLRPHHTSPQSHVTVSSPPHVTPRRGHLRDERRRDRPTASPGRPAMGASAAAVASARLDPALQEALAERAAADHTPPPRP
jgi:hypothetical protein